jgi:hypothetical protein
MITLSENKPTEQGYYVICDDRDDLPEVVTVTLLGGELWYSYEEDPVFGMVSNTLARWSEQIDVGNNDLD